MLAPSQRIGHSRDFTRAVRHGRRVRRGHLVAHIAPADEMTRCGFIVSKAVGNSVIRHRVTRRLRALCHDQYADLPPSSLVVLRALPSAGAASFDALRADLRQIAGTVRTR
ncbi:ribonuclease P protein component [Epidermidibacterium keratini]|uniref:Ribonuclease P protein component n=1 Tax=Epidermidibacterium keratini TaxID=1891644 RepID=A0A7L4YMH1_9ACTN|nr:ribonuclease P protein component [Epidermidibacterium keratini]QHC00481.1 ribonuclease P protein component [Epidermidibacterium keratini]